MTEKYQTYIEMLAARDQALTSLALMAFGCWLAWLVLATIPDPWRRQLRTVYVVIGGLVYIVMLIWLIWLQVEA